MAGQKLGTLGVLDILLAGDTANLKRATKEGATNLEKMGAVARSTATSVAKLSAAIGAAGAAVFALVSRVAKTGDEFAKMSDKVGASTEFLSAFAHAAKLGGVGTEQMEKALGRMTRTMSDAQNGLATAKRSFDDLGVKVQEADGNLREVPDVVLEIADRIAGMTDQTKAAALAQEVFGRAGLDMLPVLKQGSAALREQMEEAKRLGKVWTTDAAKAAVDFNDNVTKLKAGVEGLSMQMAGPFVKAFGEAMRAMLEAQRQGESFFRIMSEGIFRLSMGSDLQNMQRELAGLGPALIKAQDALDEARRVQSAPGQSEFGARLMRQAEQEVAAITARMKVLQGILQDPFAAPAAPADGKPKPTGTTGGGGMTDAQKKEQEALRKLLGEQFQWELDEEQRVREELGAIYIAAHEKRLSDEKQLQADLQAAKIEGYEWEQEQAIAQGEELLAIDKAIAEQKQAQRQREQKANADFWNNLAGLMNTGSKKAFEIGKAFSLGQAAIKGASAVMSAWEAGMSTGGPWAPVVAAAYAAAAGLNAINLMNNIRSQQFGGGGGAPVAPTQGASNVSPVGAGGGGQGRERPIAHTTVVLPATDLTSTSAVRQMLLGLQEEISANGGSLTVR